MREVRMILAFVLAGIILGLAGGILLFVWRTTEYLTEMSAGMILGLLMAMLIVGVSILPMVYLLNRSREADKQEFMMAQSRMRTSAPRFDVSLLDTSNGRGDDVAFGSSGMFNLHEYPMLTDDLDDF